MNPKQASHAALLAIGLAIVGHPTASAETHSAREVMQKNLEATTLAHAVSTSTLTIGSKDGDARSKTFSLWRKRAADGVHFRTVTRFSEPVEIRGEGVLFDERPNGQNEVLLYLPRYKKVRRVEAQAQKSSFMGSSFSYADMTTQAVDDYAHAFEAGEPCPGGGGATCWVVRSTPANDSVLANHGYAKKRTWVRQSDYQTIQTELFDAGGALWKRTVFADIREVDAAAHKSLPYSVRVDDLKTGRFSAIKIKSVDAAAAVGDALFTEQSLAREM
jgi:hypothetical protein